MPTVVSAMLANKFSTSTCFAIFELIKFMCFGSTLSYLHKEFINPLPPCSKFNPPRMQSSADSHTHPANMGTRTQANLPCAGV